SWLLPAPSCQVCRDGLDLRIKVEYILAHLAPPAGLLVAAERQCRIENIVAVDPDAAGTQTPGDPVRGTDIPRPNRGRQPVDAVIRFTRDFIRITERYRGHDGAEDLLTH